VFLGFQIPIAEDSLVFALSWQAPFIVRFSCITIGHSLLCHDPSIEVISREHRQNADFTNPLLFFMKVFKKFMINFLFKGKANGDIL
jgi:hypothetical protein